MVLPDPKGVFNLDGEVTVYHHNTIKVTVHRHLQLLRPFAQPRNSYLNIFLAHRELLNGSVKLPDLTGLNQNMVRRLARI